MADEHIPVAMHAGIADNPPGEGNADNPPVDNPQAATRQRQFPTLQDVFNLGDDVARRVLDYLFWQTLSPYLISFLNATCRSFRFCSRWFELIWNRQTVPPQFRDPLDLERAANNHLFYLRKPVNLGVALYPTQPNQFDAGPNGQIVFFKCGDYNTQHRLVEYRNRRGIFNHQHMYVENPCVYFGPKLFVPVNSRHNTQGIILENGIFLNADRYTIRMFGHDFQVVLEVQGTRFSYNSVSRYEGYLVCINRENIWRLVKITTNDQNDEINMHIREFRQNLVVSGFAMFSTTPRIIVMKSTGDIGDVGRHGYQNPVFIHLQDADGRQFQNSNINFVRLALHNKFILIQRNNGSVNSRNWIFEYMYSSEEGAHAMCHRIYPDLSIVETFTLRFRRLENSPENIKFIEIEGNILLAFCGFEIHVYDILFPDTNFGLELKLKRTCDLRPYIGRIRLGTTFALIKPPRYDDEDNVLYLIAGSNVFRLGHDFLGT